MRRIFKLPHKNKIRCLDCGVMFYPTSPTRYCGMAIKEDGCAGKRRRELITSPEYLKARREKNKTKRDVYRVANPPPLHRVICANEKCKGEFSTTNRKQIYCGSFTKRIGCSWLNQQRFDIMKEKLCRRCGKDIRGRPNGALYCGWASYKNYSEGEGCALIVFRDKGRERDRRYKGNVAKQPTAKIEEEGSYGILKA